MSNSIVKGFLLLVLMAWMSVPSVQGQNESSEQTPSIAEIRSNAEAGDAEAQLNLGFRYHDGEGVPQDYAEALKWLRMAAEQGIPVAQGALATMYVLGEGVAKDFQEAMKWYRLAADQQFPPAQCDVGIMYRDGEGVPQDFSEAARWFRLAAEQGNSLCQSNLGELYYAGRGVPQDDAEAVKWFRLAAEQGDAWAQYRLGVSYFEGRGVRKDYAEAAKWFRLAAEQGNPLGQANLGRIYSKGQGVPKDFLLAHMWLNLAAAETSGSLKVEVVKLRDSASKKLTPQQLTETWKQGTEIAIAAGMETLRFSPGENWVVGYNGNSGDVSLTEMVPKGETVKNWTEMITLARHRNVSGENLDPVAKASPDISKKGCTRGHHFEEKERGEIGGHPMFIVVVRCDSAAKRPGQDKSVQGKPETYVSLTIGGRQDVYTIQRAARRSDLSDATIREWIDFLKTAQVCNSQIQPSPCK